MAELAPIYFDYHKTRSIQLRNKIVESNMGLVKSIAFRFKNDNNEKRVSIEDLQQVGTIGLINAVEKFNPYKGYAFSTYAVMLIRSEMLHWIRDRANLVRVPANKQQLYYKIKKIAFKEKISYYQAASKLEVSREEAEYLSNCINEWHYYLDQDKDRREVATRKDCYEELEKEENAIAVQHAINELPDRQRKLVRSHYLELRTKKELSKSFKLKPCVIKREIDEGLRRSRIKIEEKLSA